MTDTVLLEAWCRLCEEGFDIWAEATSQTWRIEIHNLRCPNCLNAVRRDDLQEKESLL